mmetsp:Transcript_16939/g.27533  ORF Transcript_16939/g.27533 Transcript_16939/m.27533 type:complete len:473 (-) Transcript_16939:1534-2952(-)
MTPTPIPLSLIFCFAFSLVSSFHHPQPASTSAVSRGNRCIYLCARRSDGHADEGIVKPSTPPTRREALVQSAAAITAAVTSSILRPSSSLAIDDNIDLVRRRTYVQQFPTLFDPLYGESERETIKRQISENIWSIEQSLILGPLETPLRCVVVKLSDGTLWVHAPLAPTAEFFDLVESCSGSGGVVSSVVVPTYALEHKVFVKDALERWPNAKLWTSPGQFSFPIRSASDKFVWGRPVDGILRESDTSTSSEAENDSMQPSWTDEIQYETLTAGTFSIGGTPTPLYETAFYHRSSKTLIVTDAVAQVPLDPPPLNRADSLLLISKRSTSDPMPEDTAEARQIGWEKTALLISYFFPEHEEPDPNNIGVVTWTDGWHDNFSALAGRLIVPPVVRTLLYAQNPQMVRRWVDRVSSRWEFERIVPAHWEAPISATPDDFRKAFRFLEDDAIDAFPANDLKRGLKPIADIALKSLT